MKLSKDFLLQYKNLNNVYCILELEIYLKKFYNIKELNENKTARNLFFIDEFSSIKETKKIKLEKQLYYNGNL